MTAPLPANPQVQASDPKASVFVAANAGSGKTSTLVKRVARLLLAGARPEAILCVTYTKAGAAEMQRRLFQQLGGWAIARDEALIEALADINEDARDLSSARALFARALETPGGLKIQTIHAFCEQLLRRFPLEAGVSPGFTIMDDVAARMVSLRARDDLADAAMADPEGVLARAYKHLSVELDWTSFNKLFKVFTDQRAEIVAYVDNCEAGKGIANDVWRRCGFGTPADYAEMEQEALGRIRWRQWSSAADALLAGTPKTDQPLGRLMKSVGSHSCFADVWAVFSTGQGTPRAKLGTQSVDRSARDWLVEEQARHVYTHSLLVAASVAESTVYALTLARAFGAFYEITKGLRGSLDFDDLIAHAHRLLTVKADATWVLFKLDGGLEHVLLDEGQDTAPKQWDILRALTAEFFAGLGAGPIRRTIFAVADEKQSIFSFQGAAPDRFAVEKQRFQRMVNESGFKFIEVNLQESWRSAPEILSFVDMVFRDPHALKGLSPSEALNVLNFPLIHSARRPAAGCVDLWPLEAAGESVETDAWAPVDSEPEDSANRRLARRIARAIVAMVAARDSVLDRDLAKDVTGDGVLDRSKSPMRPCGYGDMLILVRRRSPLFHEIIRALKKEGVPVGGADRLKLSEHGVFEDMMALARLARFTGDDLTLAGVLRGPFCDVGEQSLFDLAHARDGSLWATLVRRATERPEWDGARRLLSWARSEGARAAPFDFFSRVMDQLDDAGRSMRQRLYTRMGADGEDAADAFLAEALNAEERGARDLETFIATMSLSEIEVKREAEDTARAGEGEVRVMTVHGAKGLEAPIVILPDTSARALDQGAPLMDDGTGGFLWAPRAADGCLKKPEDCCVRGELRDWHCGERLAYWTAARDQRQRAVERESSRLLYVALTRARDRLILCGVESQRHRYERSWRDYMQRAFDELPIHPFALEGGGEGWRYGLVPVPADRSTPPIPPTFVEPPWVRAPAPPEPAAARYASPSALDGAVRAPAPSPIAVVAGLGRFRRGDIIHRLLQVLPELPAGERPFAAMRLLGRERDLSADQRAEMTEAALGVLNDRRFAAVFGPGSKAEVALAGTARDIRISGRVDRLVVEDDRVLVIDFKTNRPSPRRIEDADEAYLLQMALYVVLLREVFPGRTIEAALIWTDGPKLMPVPGPLIDRVLDELVEAG